MTGVQTCALPIYNDFLLPADAVGRFQVDRFRLGKVTMSCSRFMLYESGQDFTIGKSGGNAGRISQITSSVVAYIDNQSVAGCQIDKDFIQIAIADPGTETFVADISDIIVEYFVLHPRRCIVVLAGTADRKSTRLNSSHPSSSRMPSSA